MTGRPVWSSAFNFKENFFNILEDTFIKRQSSTFIKRQSSSFLRTGTGDLETCPSEKYCLSTNGLSSVIFFFKRDLTRSTKLASWMWSKVQIKYRFKFTEIFRSFGDVGHCSKFGSALWATSANLVMHYGTQRWIWWWNMGHCGKFGQTLWATVWMKPYSTNLWWFLHCGPLHRILFCNMSNNTGFC